ncbi:MAG TPA: ABC transporter substrate-binding protein [Novimethylophilus sp.]|jgi:NitT/TauT family transport system substrate-binding protein|uniref:ABC transporter substrate-binding protein n=1 Tax=Novimethylophilus sp. TaxID=2137426 RepID=UPI002F419CDB
MPSETTALPVLRASFEATGSGRWLMQTIVELELDRNNGFELDLALSGDSVKGALQATEARLAAGEVDFIDTDWLSIARCRRAGLHVTGAVPYGAIFGGMVAPNAGELRTLADLPGMTIGVVRRQDKNWLLLRAYCKAALGFDPALVCQLVEAGSKSALHELLYGGELDAALLFWHQVPALVAGGDFFEVCDLLDLLPELGVRCVPSTFFVFQDALVAAHPELVRGFAAALRAAYRVLHADADAWQQATNCHRPDWQALRGKWLSRMQPYWQPGMAADLAKLTNYLGAFDAEAQFNGLPEGTLSASFLQ